MNKQSPHKNSSLISKELSPERVPTFFHWATYVPPATPPPEEKKIKHETTHLDIPDD